MIHSASTSMNFAAFTENPTEGVCLRLKKFPCLEEWLEEELKLHKFCILLFYRGEWDRASWDFFSTFDDTVPQLRRQGGELFVIVPNSRSESKKMEKHLGLNFKIISDPGDKLAQKYQITCPNAKSESRIKSLLKVCLKAHYQPTLTRCRSMSIPPSSTITFTSCHPGVVILSKKYNPETKHWVTSRTIKNSYETKETFSPTGMNDLLDLHFGRRRSTTRAPSS